MPHAIKGCNIHICKCFSCFRSSHNLLSNTHCTSAKAAAINLRANRKVPSCWLASHSPWISLCQQFTHHVPEFQVQALPKIFPQCPVGSLWETLRAWPSDCPVIHTLGFSHHPRSTSGSNFSKWLYFPQRGQNKIQQQTRSRTKKVPCLLYHLLRHLSSLCKNATLKTVHFIPA